MNITIQSVNFKAGASLEQFIFDEISKLFKHSDWIIRAEVTLRYCDSSNAQCRSCDIRPMVPGHDHFVSRRTDVF